MKVTIALLLLASLLAATGCNRTGNAKAASRVSGTSAQWSDDLFNFAIANLNHLEDNDCQEMMRTTQERLEALQQLPPDSVPTDALQATWPEPDMLRQVVSRLNQWVDTLDKPAPWTPDPMLASLPPELGKLPMVKDLAQPHFTAFDGYMLMEAVWARDVTRWAKGDTSDDLLVARNLFDWTIRNIELDYDQPSRMPQVPWETLYLGHGTAMERAWAYILLLRQCNIDAAILALPPKGAKGEDSGAELKPWCVAVLLGDKEKKLYLFDPSLGLPIPTSSGVTAGNVGQLEIQPVSLDQLVADPKLLDRLTVSADEPYWVTKDDLKHAVVLIEASPLYMEPRAKRVEATLAGDRKLVLSAEPSQQADRFKTAGMSDVRLWDLPYTTLERRMGLKAGAVFNRLAEYFCFIGFGSGSLYKGRILHLKGRFYDEKGAIAYYQRARPRTRDVLAEEKQRLPDYYKMCLNRLISQGIKPTPEMDARCKRDAIRIFNLNVNAVLQGKVDAAYWLGLIEYEQGQYESALDYFLVRTLQAGPDVSWTAAARYNIGRSYEASGRWAEAVEDYQRTIYVRDELGKTVRADSLEAGNQLRAKWLKEIHPTKPAEPEKKPEAKKPDEKKADQPKKSEDGKAEKKTEVKPPEKKP